VSSRSPIRVLFRLFFAQFFASESVTSDIQLRQTLIWVLAFLITPGAMLALQVVSRYAFAVYRQPSLVDTMTAALAIVFVTYSSVTTGLVAVSVWDALAFDRRDAMVLGPLPVGGTTVIAAKVGALGAFLLGTVVGTNVLAAALFALVASGSKGLRPLGLHVVAHMTATVAAGVFIFSSLITIRGLLVFVRGPRLSAALGALMQLAFMGALFSSILLMPAAVKTIAARAGDISRHAWLPTAWFLGLYETLRGRRSAAFVALAADGVSATALAVLVAVVVSIAGYRRQQQLALAPPSNAASDRQLGLGGRIARRLVGRDPVARAVLDFLLITLARNRALHTMITMNAAVAIPVVAAALWRTGMDLSALARPRTIVFWIPLVVAFWVVIGVRASFFVPSELSAAWTFNANAPTTSRAYPDAARAAFVGLVLPFVLALSATVTTALLGWQVAVWHTLFVAGVVALLVEIVLLTIDHVPFTRAYPPGHAKLRTRWLLYLFGMYACAYWPVQVELRFIARPAAMSGLIALTFAATTVVAMCSRRQSGWSLQLREGAEADVDEITSLGIGRSAHGAHVRY
jgi:hypothetical protein